jgi:three-Cys-motif partner protein
MNRFGGNWTEQKLQILETYAKQYLTVFKNKPNEKLIYFDGFAGSGEIETGHYEDRSLIEGAAIRILRIDDPRSFNMYYFVEKIDSFARALKEKANEEVPEKKSQTFVVSEDCNKKLHDLAKFLRSNEGRKYKVLGFIDPKGMQLEWLSLEILKGLPIDLWILNPTSGANRLLEKKGQISATWIKRLTIFLGLPESAIMEHFYNRATNLFGETELTKEDDPINKLHELYSRRIKDTIFKYVSKPKILRNDVGSPLFHFFMATNNEIGLKIANAVVNPKLGF